jgi:esterase
MSAKLSVQEIVATDAAPTGWIAILHGILGSGRNWAAVARRVVRARPDSGVLLVDLRQHGASQGFDPPHTLERTASDLDSLEQAGQVRTVVGHSFGGKIALLRGRDDDRVGQVWVLDSTPDTLTGDSGPGALIRLLRRLPAAFESRDAAVEQLRQSGIESPVALWMATNLEHADGEYRWRLDLDDMEAMLQDFSRTDLWPLVEEPRADLLIHFVRATGSPVLGADAVGRIRAAGERTGRVFLHEVTGGHWLNADNPDALSELFARHL